MQDDHCPTHTLLGYVHVVCDSWKGRCFHGCPHFRERERERSRRIEGEGGRGGRRRERRGEKERVIEKNSMCLVHP